MSSTLALDLATTTGWSATHKLGGESGFVKLKSKSFGEKMLQFEWALEGLIARHAPERVVVEQPVGHFKSRTAARILYGMYAILCKECHRRKLPLREVNASTLKKWATGDGRAPKEKMIEWALERGFTGKDHNEADAWLLASYDLEVPA